MSQFRDRWQSLFLFGDEPCNSNLRLRHHCNVLPSVSIPSCIRETVYTNNVFVLMPYHSNLSSPFTFTVSVVKTMPRSSDLLITRQSSNIQTLRSRQAAVHVARTAIVCPRNRPRSGPACSNTMPKVMDMTSWSVLWSMRYVVNDLACLHLKWHASCSAMAGAAVRRGKFNDSFAVMMMRGDGDDSRTGVCCFSISGLSASSWASSTTCFFYMRLHERW